MTELKRRRILAALLELVAVEGYSALTVTNLIDRSRTSRKTFHDVFGSLENAFLAAFEEVLRRGRETARAAYYGQSTWRSSMRAALLAVLVAMEQERGMAKLCVIDSLCAGPASLERRSSVLAEVAQAIDHGRDGGRTRSDVEPIAAQAIAGGIAEILHARLLAGEHPITDLLGPLMSLVVLPYLGPAVAREEASTPPPPCPPLLSRAASPDPTAGVNMRVTYRTMRVLHVIGERPGASNRDIAESAGIADAGQVSRLTRRVEGLGLARNTVEGRAYGGSNAWHLTALGERIRRASRAR